MLQAFLDGAVFGASSGDGLPRVVCLHGWRRTHDDFAAVGAALASDDVASLYIDLPGFGATPPPAEPMGARGYATQLRPLVAAAAAAAGPIVLVGHSFGGRVAICLAATSPASVAGVVLAGVPLVRSAMPTSQVSQRYRAIRRLARLGLVSPARLEAARKQYGSADYRAASGAVRDVLVTVVQESYEPELAATSCPIDLVWGADDTTVPVRVAEAARSIAPTATLSVLVGVGHLVPVEAPGELADRAAALLRGRR